LLYIRFPKPSCAMLTTHLKVAFRHLTRSKIFTLINVIGLSIGISAFLLIVHYISFQLSYDQFHTNKDYIYRIGLKRYENGELVETSAKTFPGIRMLLKENFPEVRSVTGFYKIPANTGFLFRYQGKIYNETGGWLSSDSAFFAVFPSLLLHGKAATAMKEPNSIAISETIAKKLFGDKDPVGQILDRIDDHSEGGHYTIRGVIKDIPENAHFHATIIEQINDTRPEASVDLWGEGRLMTYVTFSDKIQPDVIEQKLNRLLHQLEKENKLIKDTEVYLQPITDIHLSSHCKDELEANGNKELLYLLGCIGFIILVIAWINYINLETSRFISRTKEFSVRRVIGSGKLNLAVQYLTEYCCLTLGAFTLSVVVIIAFAPYYTDLTGVQLEYISANQSFVWTGAAVLFLIGSVSAGIYPAIFLLKFDPVAALKGNMSKYRSGSKVRQTLVVFQFTVSIILVAFVMTVQQQLDFMKLINKGIELETVVAIRNPTAYSNQELTTKYGEFETFQNKLMQYPAVQSLASSSAIPGSEIGFNYVNLIKRNIGDPYDPAVYKTLFVSADFINTYNIDLIAGNSFEVPSKFNGTAPWETANWSSVILNERATRQLGFTSASEALNQEIYFEAFDEPLKCRIIGVISDYHHEATKKEVYPTILFHNYATFQQVYFSVRLKEGSRHQQSLSQIESTWRELFPDRPFDYFFLDEYYDRQFRSEVYFQKIFTLFAGIAIIVACLGIVGITLFEMNSRLKEISIRKVLGASVLGVTILLSKTNVRLIAIASILATPLIYILAKEWLSSYPERIQLTAWLALLPVTVIMIIVLIVSGFQTIKTANANPVDHLGGE
jgi:putative ABC transport system permease protein